MIFIAPACGRVQYRRPIFRPSVRPDSRMGTYVAMHFVAKIIKWLLILSAYYCPSLCVYKLHLATLGMDYLSIAIILLCG